VIEFEKVEEYKDPKLLQKYTVYHFMFAGMLILLTAFAFRLVDKSLVTVYNNAGHERYLTASAYTQKPIVSESKWASRNETPEHTEDNFETTITLSRTSEETAASSQHFNDENSLLARIEKSRSVSPDTYSTVVALQRQKTKNSATQIKRDGKYIQLDSSDDKLNLSSRSYIVADLETGEIILAKNTKQKYPIASITKYITAVAVVQNLDLDNQIQISSKDLLAHGSRAGFQIGDKFATRTLLYPLLLVSSNDAAEILAEEGDRTDFIDSMNRTSRNFGMLDTSFSDPSGLSPENISTATDLFIMLRRIQSNFPELVSISRTRSYSIDDYRWNNINRAHTLPEFRGGKTGYTDAAKKTMAGYFTIETANQEKRDIGIVILASSDRDTDLENVLEYIKKSVVFL